MESRNLSRWPTYSPTLPSTPTRVPRYLSSRNISAERLPSWEGHFGQALIFNVREGGTNIIEKAIPSILGGAHSKLSCKVLISGWLGKVVMSFRGECTDLSIRKGHFKRTSQAQKSLSETKRWSTYKYSTPLPAISAEGQHYTPALLKLQTTHWY